MTVDFEYEKNSETEKTWSAYFNLEYQLEQISIF